VLVSERVSELVALVSERVSEPVALVSEPVTEKVALVSERVSELVALVSSEVWESFLWKVFVACQQDRDETKSPKAVVCQEREVSRSFYFLLGLQMHTRQFSGGHARHGYAFFPIGRIGDNGTQPTNGTHDGCKKFVGCNLRGHFGILKSFLWFVSQKCKQTEHKQSEIK
jgi:hypothetical protein